MDSDGDSSSDEKESITTFTYGKNKDTFNMSNWTTEGKIQLLQAMKEFGINETEKIAHRLETKSTSDVKQAMLFYRTVAIFNYYLTEKVNKNKNDPRHFPIAPFLGWSSVLSKKFDVNDLYTELSEAVKLFGAMHSEIPPKECCADIDLRKVYEIIGDAIAGKPIHIADKRIVVIIYKCIVESDLISKTYMRNSVICRMVNEMRVEDVDVIIRPNDGPELTVLRSILSLKRYNPFDISAEDLKLSK